ncbi:hypothetical protein QYF36_012837 [Acer negundo]|nr:hypothetical protein QYF36_012837 [Acer negundo]
MVMGGRLGIGAAGYEVGFIKKMKLGVSIGSLRYLKGWLRSEELIPGGRMVLTIRGNQSKEDSTKNYRPILIELIGMELQAMVSEGMVEE